MWILAAIVVAAAAAGTAWYLMQPPDLFQVRAEDQPVSWQLPLPQDAASATPRLRQQIADLGKLLGQGQYPDEDIEMGIANDYALIGEGQSAYHAYLRALAASSTDALAYDNLGGLFARLYATSTAVRAYAKAVALEPAQTLYQLSYLNYLAEAAPRSRSTAAAFASAKQPRGATNTNILIAESAWLASIGSTTPAIADLEAVRAHVGPAQQSAIDARIAQLKR